ncbi:MAG TPA: CPBP family intramembrane glutamic endopeptidase [Anaerolineales bacterium]|nr:CPBP family intramembrane glutamic endopeptidase [Anaerolineales bacterium]
MNTFTGFLKRYSLPIGILLMFLFTWPIDLSNSGILPFQFPFLVYLFLGWGFIFASLLMTGLTLGREAVITLLKRFLIWRVGWKWYLVILLQPALQILSIALNSIIAKTPIDFSGVFAYQIFGPAANLPLLFLPFLISDAITNGEEMGWRGYVLPRLQVQFNALASSLILGVIWAIWHLPKFLPDNTSSFGLFMIRTIIVTVMYTWIYNGTKGSLLLVTLFHAAANAGGVFLPVANTVSGENSGALIIEIVLQAIAVMVIIHFAGINRLSRTEPKQLQE